LAQGINQDQASNLFSSILIPGGRSKPHQVNLEIDNSSLHFGVIIPMMVPSARVNLKITARKGPASIYAADVHFVLAVVNHETPICCRFTITISIYDSHLCDVSSVDCIACLDACFTQSRRKGKTSQRDDPQEHPDSVFLTEDEVNQMEEFVELHRIRPRRGRFPTRNQPATTDNEDGYEPGMRVPTSTLDECNDSFTAADERRQKTSTQFFSDTGLMALLCRHDRVLWMANMTSAGERQHYALALLNRLFQNIPRTWTVGALYDIGCQLHRSCEKWGFLPEYRNRIIFAISVFHAYGHQWPCQLIYHPRKCLGFGLSDGEGCERLWSALKKLIGALRVSGVSVLFLSLWI
jgi:hypothetical protein